MVDIATASLRKIPESLPREGLELSVAELSTNLGSDKDYVVCLTFAPSLLKGQWDDKKAKCFECNLDITILLMQGQRSR